MTRTIFGRLFEDTRITARFPKDVFVTMLTLIRCLQFSTIKKWWISKQDLTILCLKKWMLVYGTLFKFKCYETGYIELSEIVTFLRNTCPWKVAVQNKHSFEKVHALNNYLFWRKSSSETVAVLKKYLSSRSSWLEKVLLTRSTYKKEVAAPDN